MAPEPTTPKRKQTTMRLRTDVMDALTERSAARGVSNTFMIEQIVAKWLNANGGNIKMEVMV
jgi:hypothetical protein